MGSGDQPALPYTPPCTPPPPRSHHGHQGTSRRLRHEQGRPGRPCQGALRPVLQRRRERFDMEYQVKKTDMEIHNLEMETSESHGTFKIPTLKKVPKFKAAGEEEAK